MTNTHSAFGADLQPFAGITSFMRCPATRDLAGVDVAVIGLPFDSGTSYRSGARFGPRKIRELSLLLRELLDDLLQLAVAQPFAADERTEHRQAKQGLWIDFVHRCSP